MLIHLCLFLFFILSSALTGEMKIIYNFNNWTWKNMHL